MGLLTDPNSGGKGANKLVKLITDYHRPLSWLSYVAGLVFLLGESSLSPPSVLPQSALSPPYPQS